MGFLGKPFFPKQSEFGFLCSYIFFRGAFPISACMPWTMTNSFWWKNLMFPLLMLCKHFVAFSASVIYVAALLCFSFLIDWMSVIRACAGVEKNGSTSAWLVSALLCVCKVQSYFGRSFGVHFCFFGVCFRNAGPGNSGTHVICKE